MPPMFLRHPHIEKETKAKKSHLPSTRLNLLALHPALFLASWTTIFPRSYSRPPERNHGLVGNVHIFLNFGTIYGLFNIRVMGLLNLPELTAVRHDPCQKPFLVTSFCCFSASRARLEEWIDHVKGNIIYIYKRQYIMYNIDQNILY